MNQFHQQVWNHAARIHGHRSIVIGNVSISKYREITRRDWDVFSSLMPDKTLVMEYGAGNGRIIRLAIRDCLNIIAYEPNKSLRTELALESLYDDNIIVVDSDILKEQGLALSSIFSCNVVPHLCEEDVVELLEFAGNNLMPHGTLVIDYVLQSCKEVSNVDPDMEHGILPIYKHDSNDLRSIAATYGLILKRSCDYPGKSRVIDQFIMSDPNG